MVKAQLQIKHSLKEISRLALAYIWSISIFVALDLPMIFRF